jgi:5-methylcytosine-specific restriction endonuclease McrBC regulatory subunit McrC
VKGVIDIPRHLRYNIPFNGRVAYRTSEYKYDNPVTQLIRHTIEYIRRSPAAGNVLKCDKSTDEAVRTIYDITTSYNANDRQRIINQNLKPVKHPFYTQYTFLQRLCLHILRHKKMSYSSSENKVYGILFDGAWLWEEYLATILCEKGFTHAVKGEENGFQLYPGGNQRFPDFYSLEKRIVLDAKYKRLNNGIQRNDLYQLITYIHTLNDGKGEKVAGAECGAFIYPYDGQNGKNDNIIWKKLFGMGGYFGVIPIEIPNDCESIEDFGVNIEKNIANINFAECPSVENETSGEIALCEE